MKCAKCGRPVRLTRFRFYGHTERLPRGTAHYVRPVEVAR